MFVKERFQLSERTKGILRDITPEFGFNGFGEIVYYRTYSRLKENGQNEDWADTVIRVTEGTFSIRKDWYIRNHISWDEQYWQNYARRFAIALFNLRWSPPGRGLWAMGTDFVYERGSMALANCGYTELNSLSLDIDLAWSIDALMCGVGVGYGINPDPDFKAYEPNNGVKEYVIPDTREGWAESVRLKIWSYLAPNRPRIIPIYDKLRGKGELIKGFGGRASGPEPLRIYHNQIDEWFHYFLGDVQGYDDTLLKADLANGQGCCVVSGNVRRSAEMLTSSINNRSFLDIKNHDVWPHREQISWMSNNSVDLEDDKDFEQLTEISERIITNGEPGYRNLRNFPFGRIGKKLNGMRKDSARGTNPCLTGDTKICLADGQGFQPIRDFEGMDIDVYCIDDNDEISIRRMRNVRKTGYSEKILKIIFDSGDSLRITPNHKLMLRNRTYVEAQNLKVGNSVAMFNRYTPLNPENDQSYFNKYISVGYGGTCLAEHKLIAEYTYGPIVSDKHIHHVDENTLNNSPYNLEVKEEISHLEDHVIGNANPNWSGYTHNDLINFGVHLCTKLGRRFSTTEWQEFGPIKSFSKYRKEEFDSIYEFACMCADLAGVLNEKVDTRTLRICKQMVEFGYEVDIVNGKVHVLKICEACGNQFWVEQGRREQASCSLSCNNTIRDYTTNKVGQKKAFAKKREELRVKQLDLYCDLKSKLGRVPQKKEWVEFCKDNGVSAEIGRDGSPFRYWSDLKWESRGHNHKVVAIIEDGYEDVYNGTVDDFHNMIIGGFEDYTGYGRRVERGIVSPQCGEILLNDKELCILAQTYPTKCSMIEEWYEGCEFAALYASTVTLLPTHQSTTNAIVAKNRRIGVSLVDFTGWIQEASVNQVTKFLRKGYKIVKKTANKYNDEAGIPHPIRYSCVQPGGTTPKLAGKTPGVGYPTFDYTLRRIRIQEGSSIANELMNANVPYEEDRYSMNTLCFEYPIIQGPAPAADKVSIWQQAMNLILVQREWADNAVSNTLYFRPKWKLVRQSNVECPECKQLVFVEYMTAQQLRTLYSCPKCDEVFHILPQVQQFYNRIKDELDFPNGFTIEGNGIYETSDTRIKIETKGGHIYSIKQFEFDPTHEEDQLESVLSMIAPLTKTVSLLPHSAKGAYVQMAEEGLTEEEYRLRKSLIKPIDWSHFRGSDGQDERYCTGPSCEITTQ